MAKRKMMIPEYGTIPPPPKKDLQRCIFVTASLAEDREQVRILDGIRDV